MKHNKLFLLGMLTVFLLLPMSVSAVPFPQCDDTPNIHMNCTFVTPPIICADNHFNITNMNGSMIQNGSLVVHNEELNSFRFNFTLVDTKADYQVFLCDDTFREVFVGGEEPMSVWIFVLLPFLMSAVLGFLSFTIDKEKHVVLRYFFGMFTLVTALFGVWFAFIINVDFYGSANLEDALSTYLVIWILLLIAVFIYLTIYMTVRHLRGVQEEKERDLEY